MSQLASKEPGPITRIPDDILISILESWACMSGSSRPASLDGQQFPWVASKVCRNWRELTLTHSSLWKRITIDLNDYQHVGLATLLARLDSFLSKSKGQKLSLTLVLSLYSKPFNTPVVEHIFQAVAKRLEHLSISYGSDYRWPETADYLRFLTDTLEGPSTYEFTYLKTLHLQLCCLNIKHLRHSMTLRLRAFEGAPSLRHVRFDSTETGIYLSIDYSRLESCQTCTVTAIPHLRGDLHHLHLKLINFPAVTWPTMPLHNLSTLKAELGYTARASSTTRNMSFWNGCVAPSLEILDITVGYNIGYLPSLFIYAPPALRESVRTLLLCRPIAFDSEDANCDPGDFRKILHCLPNLHKVVIGANMPLSWIRGLAPETVGSEVPAPGLKRLCVRPKPESLAEGFPDALLAALQSRKVSADNGAHVEPTTVEVCLSGKALKMEEEVRSPLVENKWARVKELVVELVWSKLVPDDSRNDMATL
ncbi:hypothetical protein CYLTODRAFT_208577 [Cylindrobasidium torrendii FP15055 ss-10]|uniref:Uncharacterized protein n=1 Tax=Cylindrobasidium torrendii FP15055 ss-10 TaxID=1314674 RepID=A0A0D7BIK8_9AGAR|nr:hypothetical protein CYLTODRAFT_208577 [Cylindrobasidium torrendii FP15055 ss-10]